MTNITLKPGDYVSTEGMTEDQYHAVAKAFMEAGADDGEYPTWEYAKGGCLHGFGWHLSGGLFHGDYRDDSGYWHDEADKCRHLTIAQVIGTLHDEQETIEALLAKADKHERKAAKHEAKRQECIDKARALMPVGWGIDDDRKRIRLGDEPKEDMSDPANWLDGDQVSVISDPANLFGKSGHDTLPVTGVCEGKGAWVCGLFFSTESCRKKFKWSHRPT